jgi:hypothetical protein
MSAPVVLEHTGLAAAVPNGNGWRGDAKWQYRDSVLSLRSVYSFGTGRLYPQASCEYVLNPEAGSAGAEVERQVASLDATVEESGTRAHGGVTFRWARAVEPKTFAEVYIAAADLPGHRRLRVEVFQPLAEPGLGAEIFDGILGSISYEDTGLLEAGASVAGQIEAEGLGSIVAEWGGYENVMAVRDIRGRAVGFSLDAVMSRSGNGAALEAGHYQYLRVRPVSEVVWSFAGDANLAEYFWKSEARSRGTAMGVEITFGRGESVTVQKYSERGAPSAEDLRANPASVPNAVLDVFLAAFLDSGFERAMFDLIYYDGSVKPILVSKAAAAKKGRSSPAAYALKVEIIDGRGFYQQVYFDSDKKVLQTLVQQDEPYVMERSDIGTLMTLFPERKDALMHYYQSHSTELF